MHSPHIWWSVDKILDFLLNFPWMGAPRATINLTSNIFPWSSLDWDSYHAIPSLSFFGLLTAITAQIRIDELSDWAWTGSPMFHVFLSFLVSLIIISDGHYGGLIGSSHLCCRMLSRAVVHKFHCFFWQREGGKIHVWEEEEEREIDLFSLPPFFFSHLSFVYLPLFLSLSLPHFTWFIRPSEGFETIIYEFQVNLGRTS